MPPAFNLSQDQTLQFNPSVCQSPCRNQLLTQSNLQRNYLRVSTSITLKASSQDRRPPAPKNWRQKNRAITHYPFPRSAPNSRSTHTHRLFSLLKSDAVVPAAVSGEGRIIRIETRGSTLFSGFPQLK